MQVGRAAAQVRQAPGDGVVGRAWAEEPPACVVAQQGLDGLAHAHQVGRVAKKLHIARVPGHQLQVGVDDDHALGQMLQAARQAGVGLLGRLHDPVLRGAELLGVLLQHGLQLLAAALAQRGQPLALTHKKHQQTQRQPAAGPGRGGPAAVRHAVACAVQQM
ncbi:hypothetical protein D3C71_1279310 [compost metagenome]